MQLLDNEVKYISKNTDKSFSLAAFKIEDWNSELTPWEMPLLRGKGNFGDGAGKTLEFIREKLIPNLVKLVNIQENNVKYVLGGYSLAGLFSVVVWGIRQTFLLELLEFRHQFGIKIGLNL